MAVAAEGPASRNRPRWRGDEALRLARTCYDHLAGRLGVALADALVAPEYVLLGQDGGIVTAPGEAFFADFGIELHQPGPKHSVMRFRFLVKRLKSDPASGGGVSILRAISERFREKGFARSGGGSSTRRSPSG